MRNYTVYLLVFFICKSVFADLCTNANCTANDVSTAVINLISGPTVCVNGTQIYLQLQAQTIAGANLRYDIGYFIATDGGDAKTGVCYRDYLPAPLNTTATVGLTRTSPFYNADTDTCGDIEQNITNFRNIGGTTVSSGTPGPPAIITVPCRDFNNDLVSDVGICTSWDNQSSNNCSSAAQAIPGNNSKCNCSRLKIGNIVYKATCQTNSDCNDNNACTTDTCNTNTDFKCTNTPIGAGTSCNDSNPCTTNDVCGGTNIATLS